MLLRRFQRFLAEVLHIYFFEPWAMRSHFVGPGMLAFALWPLMHHASFGPDSGPNVALGDSKNVCVFLFPCAAYAEAKVCSDRLVQAQQSHITPSKDG